MPSFLLWELNAVSLFLRLSGGRFPYEVQAGLKQQRHYLWKTITVMRLLATAAGRRQVRSNGVPGNATDQSASVSQS
jgi:hypothetical protein